MFFVCFSELSAGKCCQMQIPLSGCTLPGTSVLIVPQWHPAAPRSYHHHPLPPCLPILLLYSAACLERWLVPPHLLHSYPVTWHCQAASAASALPVLCFCAPAFKFKFGLTVDSLRSVLIQNFILLVQFEKENWWFLQLDEQKQYFIVVRTTMKNVFSMYKSGFWLLPD